MTVSEATTSDERVMAALAHASVLLSFLGPIGPVLVWVSQRRKSAYASFHALQAMGYQMTFFWIGLAVGLLLAIFWACLFFPSMMETVQNEPENFTAPLAFESGFMILMFSIWGIYGIVGILGAAMCLLKKDFHYPWVGRRLTAYLGLDLATGVLDETKEEHFVAAMSHASAILILWGLLSPLAVWVTQKDRSPYLRFHGLQATIYQSLATIGFMIFTAVYIAMFMGFIVAASPVLSGNSSSDVSVIGVLILGIIILLIWLVFLLALPTYHLFAMIAGIQILKGKDYRYPLLGNFIARRLKLDETKKEG